MIKEFIAKEPWRYIQIERSFTMTIDKEHRIKNSITGYKMLIDIGTGIYSELIQEGSPEWQPFGEERKVTNTEAFWQEVGEGQLIEVNQITPLTPQQWWDLAPWQGMDSVPLEKDIIIKFRDGYSCTGKIYSKLPRYSVDTCVDGRGRTMDHDKVIAWLPLPENK